MPGIEASIESTDFLLEALEPDAQNGQAGAHEIGTATVFAIIDHAGSPWQNGKIESFNGKFRDECLNLEWFRSRAEAKVVIETWRKHYNAVRPHSGLNYLTPDEFVARGAKPQDRARQGAKAAAICGVVMPKACTGTTPLAPCGDAGQDARSGGTRVAVSS